VTENGPAPATENAPAPATENAPAPATENVPAAATENVPAPATENARAPVTENAPAPATENVPAPVTENVPAPATENAQAPATANVLALATVNVPIPVVCKIFRPKDRLVINSHQNAIMCMQTRTETLAGRIWMDGRRKIKMAGVIQSNLLKLAATWIINIKQGSAGQAIQAETSRKRDSQIHVLHRVGNHNHLVQAVAEAEVVVEGAAAEVEAEVEAAEGEEVEDGVNS